MALPLANDLAEIFNIDEFAQSITYQRAAGRGDSTIKAIFDNETIPIDAGGMTTVHQEQPRVTCRTVDVQYIQYDDAMIISSHTYYVRAWIHDGTGVTVVQLEKA